MFIVDHNSKMTFYHAYIAKTVELHITKNCYSVLTFIAHFYLSISSNLDVMPVIL